VGASDGPVTTTGGLLVQPRFTIDDHPPIDVLVVPGGVVDAELERREVVTWIAAQQQTAELTVSVCTGAFLLDEPEPSPARARRPTGTTSATSAGVPDTTVVDGPRWVDEAR